MDKITVKLNRDVYKRLQQIKIDTGCKTISDAIEGLMSDAPDDRVVPSTGKSRAVSQYTLEGQFVKTYSSIARAEKQTGVNSVLIGRVCRGLGKTAGGYKWVFAVVEDK